MDLDLKFRSGNSVCILFILQRGLEFFLTKLGNSDPSYYRNILTPLYLKFKSSAHVQIAFTHYIYYLQISWFDMNLKFTLKILLQPPALGKKVSYDVTTVSMSVGKRVFLQNDS